MSLAVPYANLITAAGARYGIEPALIAAISHFESGFNPNAIGDDGHSVGLMQLHDQGAGAGWTVEARLDPATNIDVGTAYLRRCIDAFPGNLELAISAYNQGIGGARTYGVAVNSAYVDAIMTLYRMYGGALAPIPGLPSPPLGAAPVGCATRAAGGILAIATIGGLLAWLL